MSLPEVAATYSRGGFEPGTLVCAPGKDQWLPPYDHLDIMDRALPAGDLAARPPQPTFSDVTVMLGVEESQKLSRLAQPSQPNVPAGAERSHFFGNDDVDDAMDAFDNIVSEAPTKALKPAPHFSTAPRSSSRSPSAPPPPKSRPTSVSATTRPPPPPSVPPPSALSPGAAPNAPFAIPPAGLAARAVPPPSAPPLPSRPASVPPPAFPTSRTAPPPPPTSRPPAPPSPAHPPHSHPQQPARPQSPSAPPPFAAVSHAAGRPFISSAPTLIGSAPPPLFAAPPQVASAPPPVPSAPTLEFSSGAAPQPGMGSLSIAPDEPTFGTLTRPPRRQKSSGLFSLFLVLVTITGALFGVYFLRPALFDRGVGRIRALIGLESTQKAPPRAKGPPFDAPAAGEVLGRIAGRAGECRTAEGPTGKGRAQVLYEPSGTATSVAVSEPFHQTSVGQCLIDMLMQTKVPPFGGDPVVVSKTFDVK